MPEAKMVQLSNLVSNRDQPPDEDVETMAKDLAKRGLKEPIVINPHNVIIDGWLKVAAARSLGWTEIQAIVPSNLFEVAEVLQPRHVGRKLPIARMRSMVNAVRYYWNRREDQITSARLWREKFDEAPPKTGIGRGIVAFMMDMPIGHIQHLVGLLNRVNQGDPVALDIYQRYDEEKMTPYSAYGILMRATQPKLKGDITSAKEQRAIIERAISTLETTALALSQLGVPVKMDHEELKDKITKMRVARAKISNVLNQMEKELET